MSTDGVRVGGERQRGPAEAPNLGTPSEPRPAASVVLLRRGGKHGDRALEVLLLKRTDSAKFMPGVWVFPGGAVDAADGEGEAGHPGLRRARAGRGGRDRAARRRGAGPLLAAGSRPEVISTRFDAWFFLALAPAHSPPKPDGVETVEAAWFEPRAALEAQEAGELVARLPDRQAARIAAAPSRPPRRRSPPTATAQVEPILPKVIGTAEDHRVVLPGDPDYPA